jgi:predicted nucleotidyltransferase component of viral defense system
LSPGRAASIHARLLARAKERGEEFEAVLTRFATERFLYRLSMAPAGDALWLKGALLFDLWFDVPHRPTRDADFLGFGPPDAAKLEAALREACAVAVDDGMTYVGDSIRIAEIREEARYGGLRVRLVGHLGKARSTLQLDVGYGDAVTPGPEEATYPTLLADLPPPRLRVYPRETVVAEKLETIVSFGMANSRMKDYFDLSALAREGATDPAMLARAICATFARRGTALPSELPLGLSDEFAEDRTKLAQWNAFLRKNRLEAPPLAAVAREVREFVEAPLQAARESPKLP